MSDTSYYEYRDLILSVTDVITGQYTFYVSLISAYLVVAYFVGKKLTRFQVIVLTVIYSFGVLGVFGAVTGSFDQYLEFREQTREAYPELVDFPSAGAGISRWIVRSGLFSGFLMSLLFMWGVRRQKAD